MKNTGEDEPAGDASTTLPWAVCDLVGGTSRSFTSPGRKRRSSVRCEAASPSPVRLPGPAVKAPLPELPAAGH